MICLRQHLGGLLSSFIIAYPLCFYGITAFTWFLVAVAYYFRNRSVINPPKPTKFSVAQQFGKVSFFKGISHISAFQKFYSRYDFVRQTFFHNRYILVENKGTTLYNGKVYNLSVWEDESYITEIGITHNCRCTAVEVLAKDYTKSDSQKAIAEGEKATTQISKTGKNKLELFRFNPGKEKKVFPPKNAYQPKHCNGDKVNLTGLLGHSRFVLNSENEKCQAKKVVEEMAREEHRKMSKIEDKKHLEWFSSKIKKGHFDIINETQFSGEVRVSKSNIENLLKHISSVENKVMVRDYRKILKDSKYIKSEKLDNKKDPKNYGKKVGRGVLLYRYYDAVWNGIELTLHMEVMKDGYEQPYTFSIKK